MLGIDLLDSHIKVEEGLAAAAVVTVASVVIVDDVDY